jgi:hypothetical protein
VRKSEAAGDPTEDNGLGVPSASWCSFFHRIFGDNEELSFNIDVAAKWSTDAEMRPARD